MQIKDPLGVGNKPLERKDQAGSASRVGRATGTGSGDQAAAAANDKVELSGRSREMAKAADAAGSAPAVRAQKVAEIKQQVENNEYQVDADKVAHKMIVDFLGELV